MNDAALEYFDIHTHDLNATRAIISTGPGFPPVAGRFYSVGIHPWEPSGEIDADWLMTIRRRVAEPCVVAVGETGLDKLKGAPLERQMEIMRGHIAVSEESGKPLILHVVKAFPEIIALKNEIKPSQPWIIHGFRGKPQLAGELVRHGFYISLGEHFNQDVPAVVPPDGSADRRNSRQD